VRINDIPTTWRHDDRLTIAEPVVVNRDSIRRRPGAAADVLVLNGRLAWLGSAEVFRFWPAEASGEGR
jgi:hypothetical protein